MRLIVPLFALLAAGNPAQGSTSLFARLVDASSKGDQKALVKLLATETLTTSTGTIVEGNRYNGGEMHHGVSATEIAGKLEGCAVKGWRDVGSPDGSAYILWECPKQRAPENECYYYSYRASMLDPRFHPANLLVGGRPTWDARCGVRVVAPPRSSSH